MRLHVLGLGIAMACNPRVPEPPDPCPKVCETLKALGCSWAPQASCLPVCHEPGYPGACIASATSCEGAARCR